MKNEAEYYFQDVAKTEDKIPETLMRVTNEVAKWQSDITPTPSNAKTIQFTIFVKPEMINGRFNLSNFNREYVIEAITLRR